MSIEDIKLPTFSALVLKKLEFICRIYSGANKAARAHGTSALQIKKWRQNPLGMTVHSMNKIDLMYAVAWEKRGIYARARAQRALNDTINHGKMLVEPPT